MIRSHGSRSGPGSVQQPVTSLVLIMFALESWLLPGVQYLFTTFLPGKVTV